MYGRHGDAPLPVLAAATPADCFEVAIEAVRIATKYMTPVILLTDGYLANAAEPWRSPTSTSLPPFPVEVPHRPRGLPPVPARPRRRWRASGRMPGTPGLEHRIGGLERRTTTGPHLLRPGQPPAHDQGPRATRSRASRTTSRCRRWRSATSAGELAVVGWGSTFGAIDGAVQAAVRGRAGGLAHPPAHICARCRETSATLLRASSSVLVPEMNNGQLVTILLRARYLVDAAGLHKVTGQPFKIAEIAAAIAAARLEEHTMTTTPVRRTRRTTPPTRKCAGVRVRRLRDPQGGAEDARRHRRRSEQHRVRLRHRLLVAFPYYMCDLRLSHASTGARRRSPPA